VPTDLCLVSLAADPSVRCVPATAASESPARRGPRRAGVLHATAQLHPTFLLAAWRHHRTFTAEAYLFFCLNASPMLTHNCPKYLE